jgi:hypothetical protein
LTRTEERLSRRDLIRSAATAAVALALPGRLGACGFRDPDRARLAAWLAALRGGRRNERAGPAAVHVGELARGTPYVPFTLDAYLESGGDPSHEPLTLSLTRFDCVTLVESCLALARAAAQEERPTWERFGQEVERMRYRNGRRRGYGSRLHYFSEWISDGERRGLVSDVGRELGGAEDTRPLRFMSEHRTRYRALSDERVFREVKGVERRLDQRPRFVVPSKQIPALVGQIQSGDVLAFATEISGLDVTHAAFAYRGKDGILRVLHAPLSGGVVEITRATLPEYVAAIRRCTGVMVARPV